MAWYRLRGIGLLLSCIALAVPASAQPKQGQSGTPAQPQQPVPALQGPAAGTPSPAPPKAAPKTAPPQRPAPKVAPAQPQTQAQPKPLISKAALDAFIAAQRDAFGRSCLVGQIVPRGSHRYVACGAAGLWVIDVTGGTPRLVEARDVGGEVTGFFLQGGYLWARVVKLEARPVIQYPPAGATVGTAPPSGGTPPASRAPVPPPPTRAHYPPRTTPERPPPATRARALRSRGKVLEAGPGYVVIDLGQSDGVEHGEHVELFKSVQRDMAGHRTVQREKIAVGKVDSLGPATARVVLGINERVPEDAEAVLTDERLSSSRTAPPRVGDVWEYAFVARPFAVLENLGAGIFLDGSGGYRGDDALHIEGLLQPLALATADDGGVSAWALFGTVSYDARLFEIGLGLGGQSVNEPEFGLELGSGITIVQRVRLGARDGLHLEAFTHVALFHSELEFSSARVTGQIPVGRGTWLRMSGGGGSLGLGYGELALRVLLSGNGDRESVFLTTSIGGVNAFKDQSCFGFECTDERADYAGPMVGVGMEWRK